MSEIAEQTAEIVAENVEEAIDGVVETLEVARNNPKALVAVGLLGLVAGAAGGFLVAKKRLKGFYEDLASEEIAQAKEFYASLNKVDVESGDVLSPMDVLDRTHPEAAAAVREYQGRHDAIDDIQNSSAVLRDSATPVATEEELMASEGPWDDAMDEAQINKLEERASINVFTDPTFDYEEELKHRTPDKPYIITHDEYFAAEKDYETISLTYFEMDDTVVDEKDTPVPDPDDTIGEDHLTMFGRGSKDKNIVYIRNEKLAIDFEVIKSSGSYLEEVLGMPEGRNTLKHSDQRDARRAFRHGDG